MNLVPRVAFALPKHRQPNVEPELQPAGLAQSASAPAISRGQEESNKRWINYLNRKPSMSTLEKELTNNRIKIMNMKTDYNRMKQLVKKIETRSQSQQKLRSANSLLKKRAKRGINSMSK